MILAGDHIYKQDYSRMLIDHVEKGARCTVACMPVPIEEASAFGVMDVDDTDKIIEFVEKPANPPAMPGDPTKSLASMGIYVSTPIICMNCWQKMTLMKTPVTISVKTLSRKSPKLAWRMRIHSRCPACSLTRNPSRTGVTWVRWRLLEGEPRSGFGDA